MYKYFFSIIAFVFVLTTYGDAAFPETIQISDVPFSDANSDTKKTSDTSANILLKLDQVQQQLSAIFGQLEVLENHYVQLHNKVDHIIAPPTDTPDAKKGAAKNGEQNIQLPPDAEVAVNGVLDSQDVVAAIDIKHASPEETYKKARAFITQAKYELAEAALKQFIQDYPNHSLVSPALYWMGETYFVRKDFGTAAKLFAEGYQKHSDHSKAPDHLLKLGMSLENIGQKKQACAAYRKLISAYPKANATILSLAQREIQKLQCQV